MTFHHICEKSEKFCEKCREAKALYFSPDTFLFRENKNGKVPPDTNLAVLGQFNPDTKGVSREKYPDLPTGRFPPPFHGASVKSSVAEIARRTDERATMRLRL